MTTSAGLRNRTVVVTGAARGQGLEEALLLIDGGAHVLAVDLPPDPPSALDGTSAIYVHADITDPDAWQRIAARVQDTGLPLVGLVNNAGITHRSKLSDLATDDWGRVFAVNVTGAMLGIRTLAPLMTEGGSIVNIGSIAGLTAHYAAAYTASKWALRGLTHVAANEYGPSGIRVNIVHPGFIETDMTATAPPAMREAQLGLTPLERVGQSREVAGLVAFLLSDAAAFITGAEIPVDGGFTSSAGTKIIADRLTHTDSAPTTTAASHD